MTKAQPMTAARLRALTNCVGLQACSPVVLVDDTGKRYVVAGVAVLCRGAEDETGVVKPVETATLRVTLREAKG